MDTKQQLQYIDDRGIDIKQLCIVILAKWKILLICMIIASLVMFYTQSIQGQESYRIEESTQGTNEYDERLERLNERWIDYSEKRLEQHFITDSNEETIPFEEEYYALLILRGVSDMKKNVDSMKETKSSLRTNRENGKARIIIIGMVGGFAVAFVLLFIYYIISDKVLSARDFWRRYGLRSITMLTVNKVNRIVLFGRDRLFLGMTGEEQVQMAVINFLEYSYDLKEVLLVGTVKEEELKNIADRLEKQLSDVSFSCASGIHKQIESFERLKEYKAVILVEKVFSSRYCEIDDEVDLLLMWKKSVIGSIALI